MNLGGVGAVDRAGDRRSLHARSDRTVLLAGGTLVFSDPPAHASRLLDLNDLDWPALRHDDAGLVVAATCTIAALRAASGTLVPDQPGSFGWLVRQCCDALSASPTVTSRATVGGNICAALPAGSMLAMAGASGATAVVWQADGGDRTESVVDLVVGPRRTTIGPDEVLRTVTVPPSALDGHYDVRRIARTPGARSSVLVVGSRHASAWTLTITAATPVPVVIDFPEPPTAATLSDRLDDVTASPGWLDDLDGPAAWRESVTRFFAADLLRTLSDV